MTRRRGSVIFNGCCCSSVLLTITNTMQLMLIEDIVDDNGFAGTMTAAMSKTRSVMGLKIFTMMKGP